MNKQNDWYTYTNAREYIKITREKLMKGETVKKDEYRRYRMCLIEVQKYENKRKFRNQ